ncbi:MAG: hypothetical protein AAF938_18070 [Myxococcota bacterium]
MAFRTGVVVGTFEGVAGDADLVVALLRTDGSTLAERRVASRVDEDSTLTVVFSRLCEGVTCPAPGGDASATECVAGICVSPSCTPETPQFCDEDAVCVTANDCTAPPLADCAAIECGELGVCQINSDDGACEDGFICDPLGGCGPSDALDCNAPCDTGNDCTPGTIVCTGNTAECVVGDPAPVGSLCAEGGQEGRCDGDGMCEVTCVPDMPCKTGNPCEAGITSCLGGVQDCEPAGPEDAGTECRTAAGPCDVVDICDGASVECPDAFADPGTMCAEAEGPCAEAAACSGETAACPAATLLPANTGCTLPSGGDGFCDGLSAACQDGCVPGAPCNLNECQRGTFACDGAVPRCVFDANVPDGTECRPDEEGLWSDCSRPTTCAESGTESRTVIRFACSAGSCNSTLDNETRACSVDTDGDTCGSGFSCPSFGACQFSNTCATSGTRSRTCTRQMCASGTCQSMNEVQSEGCSRGSQNGQTCSGCGTPVCECGGGSCGPRTTTVQLNLRDARRLAMSCGAFDSCDLTTEGSCTLTCPLGIPMSLTCRESPTSNDALILRGTPTCDECTDSGPNEVVVCNDAIVEGLDIDCDINERC